MQTMLEDQDQALVQQELPMLDSMHSAKTEATYLDKTHDNNYAFC